MNLSWLGWKRWYWEKKGGKRKEKKGDSLICPLPLFSASFQFLYSVAPPSTAITWPVT
jgi:hypothetical protein